jgi:hypothetical protein
MPKLSAEKRALYALAEFREAARELYPELEFEIIPIPVSVEHAEMVDIIERDFECFAQMTRSLREGIHDFREEQKRDMN